MEREVKTVKAKAGSNPPARKRPRALMAVETRTVEQRLADALAQQAATSRILRVMAESPSDVQPVMSVVAEEAARLCQAPFARVLRAEGDVLRSLAFYSAEGEAALPVEVVPRLRTSISGRAMLERKTIHHADIVPLLRRSYPAARNNAIDGGFRAVLAVPLLHKDEALGAIFLWRREPGFFAPDHVALVETFATQAAIAIENVRLFNDAQAHARELAESLQQQTATNEVLKAISRSTFDLGTVLHTLVESAARLCDADKGTITRQRDGRFYRAEAYGFSREFMEYVKDVAIEPERGSVTGRVLFEGRVVHLADVNDDPNYTFTEAQRLGEFRSIVGVPMMREGVPIGVLALTRSAVRPFTDRQIALVSAFADQAVIAIENVRLFSELQDRNHDLTEALEQQTATSEILRVISSSQTDAQPVFETIVRSVRSLCGATFSGVYLLEGERFSLASAEGLSPDELAAFAAGYPRKIGPDTVSGRAALECRVVQTGDLISDPEYSAAPGSRIGARTVLGVPLMRGSHAIGSIGVWHAEVKPFSETQIALLETFADQAVIAIENVRLFKELQERTKDLSRSVGELRALGDVGQAVSSTLDLETVLSTIVSRANQLSGMDGCAIYEYDEAREEFYLHTADSLPDELVAALRTSPIQKGEGALGALAVTGEPTQVRDIVDQRVYQSRVRKILIKHGYRSLLAVPLLRENHLLGGLVVNRKSTGEFAPQVIDLLKTFATQSTLAIQNARLFREIEVKGRQLEIASQHKSEFLANMSHELRTPLNAIIGFSEVLTERLFGDMNDKQAEYVGDITESGRHLLTLINDILDLSKIEAGRMELDRSEFVLATAIDNTLTLVRERAERRGIALRCAIHPGLATIVADERKLKQVLLNLLSNALKFTPEGGKVDVAARALDNGVEIAVTDTGVGIAPEELEAVFEEFRQVGSASRKSEGTGLGLAISRKFIELHGGRIWVTSKVGTGSTFAFTLPRG